MNTSAIVSEIDAEISRLTEAKTLLAGVTKRSYTHRGVKKSPKTAPKKHVTRHISAEGRKRIAAAQKARWAKQKREAKKAA